MTYECHQFVRTSGNIYSLYIFFVIISINYLITESKFIRANATETYNDTSDENNEALNNNNNSEKKFIRRIEESKRNSFEILTTSAAPNHSKITISSTVTYKDTTVTVWCFCNIASCVPNGYMCKSTIGACYSKSIERIVQNQQQSAHLPSNTYYDSAVNYLTRGCVEFLPITERRRCVMKLDPWRDTDRKLSLLNASEILIRSKYREEDTRNNANMEEDDNDLQCCNQDVCNYEVSQPVFVVRKSDDSHNSAMNNSFEWFRSATIAVSVAGLLILFILIVFAVRMIISDTKSYAYRQQVSRDIRSRAPFFVERTLATSESGSILCAKSLQKNDLTSFCGLQSVKSIDHRSGLPPNCMRSFTAPNSAISSCSTIDTTSHLSTTTRTCDFDFASPEEMEPLNSNRDSNHFLLDPSFPT